MSLANLKEFREAEYKRTDTGVCILWAKDITEEVEVMIYSLCRVDLEDSRPQTVESWAPHEDCEVQFFNIATLEQIDTAIASSAIEAITLAETMITNLKV